MAGRLAAGGLLGLGVDGGRGLPFGGGRRSARGLRLSGGRRRPPAVHWPRAGGHGTGLGYGEPTATTARSVTAGDLSGNHSNSFQTEENRN